MRIAPLGPTLPSPAARYAADAHARDVAPLTNVKRTRLHEPVAFRALMTWYDLRDTVRPFPGERLTTLLAHAVSAGSGSVACRTFFRRILVDAGEDPDDPVLSREETEVVAFGRALAVTPHRVPDALMLPVRARLSDAQLVALTAFGALVVATGVVGTVLEVPLDGHLEPSRPAPLAAARA